MSGVQWFLLGIFGELALTIVGLAFAEAIGKRGRRQ